MILKTCETILTCKRIYVQCESLNGGEISMLSIEGVLIPRFQSPNAQNSVECLDRESAVLRTARVLISHEFSMTSIEDTCTPMSSDLIHWSSDLFVQCIDGRNNLNRGDEIITSDKSGDGPGFRDPASLRGFAVPQSPNSPVVPTGGVATLQVTCDRRDGQMPSSRYDSVIYLGTPIMTSHRDSVQDLFSMMTWEHYRGRKRKDSVKRKNHKAVKVIEYYGINTTDSKPSQVDCTLPRKTCKHDLRTQHQR